VKWKVMLTDESFARKVLKLVEIKAVINKAKFVELKVSVKISNFLKENYIDSLNYFEKKNKIKIDIISDNDLIIPEYIIELKNKSKKTIEVFKNLINLQNLSNSPIDEDISNSKKIKIQKYKKKPFKKKYHKKSK